MREARLSMLSHFAGLSRALEGRGLAFRGRGVVWLAGCLGAVLELMSLLLTFSQQRAGR